MMRLIDADNLRAQFPEPVDWLDINQTLVHKTGIWAEIDNAETVEAIPIDWIQRYINACEMVSVMDGGAVTKWSADAVKAMLECWREEQLPTCGPDYCDINFGGGTKA